ncbi:winged helix-turn-helix transcriptional regulator [Fuscibacter oryzae]|uniref:Helix-turn-helix transcriptional regulator n=1 Tax=Fuscibacter oryzae TaxID=2803939 RepID=A0A8J7SW75_9RHOB|nr:helix-turn-helix domain-containing protein [Fuscibacter oryzae]MBL4928614.1 helix-turn-helix transcriptional regulator [Fuscibacter oryzae]
MTKTRRSYEEGCLQAHALDLIGDRWALLVVRELLLGPRRFAELRRGLPGVSANILTMRLVELEAAGLLVPGYALTDAGRALWPLVREMCHWGAAQPGHDPTRFISPASLMLSMAAMWRAPGLISVTVGFDLGERFLITVDQGRYHVARAEGGEMTFAGSTNRLAQVVYGPQTLADNLAAGGFAFVGDVVAGQRFLDGFSLHRALQPDLPF